MRKLGLHLHARGLLELDHLQGKEHLLLLQQNALQSLNYGVELLTQLSLDLLLQDIANISVQLRLLGWSIKLGHQGSSAASVQAGVDVLPEVVLVPGLHQLVVWLSNLMIVRVAVLLPK